MKREHFDELKNMANTDIQYIRRLFDACADIDEASDFLLDNGDIKKRLYRMMTLIQNLNELSIKKENLINDIIYDEETKILSKYVSHRKTRR